MSMDIDPLEDICESTRQLLDPTRIDYVPDAYFAINSKNVIGCDSIYGYEDIEEVSTAVSILLLDSIDSSVTNLQSIVLCSKKETCFEVFSRFMGLTNSSCKIRSHVSVGGMKISRDVQGLKSNPHILFCSPGRLIRLQEESLLDLSNIQNIFVFEGEFLLSKTLIHSTIRCLHMIREIHQTIFLFDSHGLNEESISTSILNPLSKQLNCPQYIPCIYPTPYMKQKSINNNDLLTTCQKQQSISHLIPSYASQSPLKRGSCILKYILNHEISTLSSSDISTSASVSTSPSIPIESLHSNKENKENKETTTNTLSSSIIEKNISKKNSKRIVLFTSSEVYTQILYDLFYSLKTCIVIQINEESLYKDIKARVKRIRDGGNMIIIISDSLIHLLPSVLYSSFYHITLPLTSALFINRLYFLDESLYIQQSLSENNSDENQSNISSSISSHVFISENEISVIQGLYKQFNLILEEGEPIDIDIYSINGNKFDNMSITMDPKQLVSANDTKSNEIGINTESSEISTELKDTEHSTITIKNSLSVSPSSSNSPSSINNPTNNNLESNIHNLMHTPRVISPLFPSINEPEQFSIDINKMPTTLQDTTSPPSIIPLPPLLSMKAPSFYKQIPSPYFKVSTYREKQKSTKSLDSSNQSEQMSTGLNYNPVNVINNDMNDNNMNNNNNNMNTINTDALNPVTAEPLIFSSLPETSPNPVISPLSLSSEPHLLPTATISSIPIHQYNTPNNQQYNIPYNQQYIQQYNTPNNQQYIQQYNTPNNQQYNIPNIQQYNTPNNQQYNTPYSTQATTATTFYSPINPLLSNHYYTSQQIIENQNTCMNPIYNQVEQKTEDKDKKNKLDILKNKVKQGYVCQNAKYFI
ncbi:hypothetical protein WA158_001803 [Blastocystis sp. Blastoise]